MECKEYSELISAYVDEMLSPQEEELLRIHLERCERCQQEVKVMKQMREMYGELGEIELPADFHQDLMKKIKNEKQVKTPISLRWRWQYGGALVATAAIVFFGLNKMGVLQSGYNITGESEILPYMTASEKSEEQNPARSYTVQETEAGVISAEDEIKKRAVQGQENSISWQINVSDLEAFKAELVKYLEDEQIEFEGTDDQIICYKVKEAKQLKEWIQNHGGSLNGALPSDTSDIKIDFTVLK